jgi:hypothetical protein
MMKRSFFFFSNPGIRNQSLGDLGNTALGGHLTTDDSLFWFSKQPLPGKIGKEWSIRRAVKTN